MILARSATTWVISCILASHVVAFGCLFNSKTRHTNYSRCKSGPPEAVDPNTLFLLSKLHLMQRLPVELLPCIYQYLAPVKDDSSDAYLNPAVMDGLYVLRQLYNLDCFVGEITRHHIIFLFEALKSFFRTNRRLPRNLESFLISHQDFLNNLAASLILTINRHSHEHLLYYLAKLPDIITSKSDIIAAVRQYIRPAADSSKALKIISYDLIEQLAENITDLTTMHFLCKVATPASYSLLGAVLLNYHFDPHQFPELVPILHSVWPVFNVKECLDNFIKFAGIASSTDSKRIYQRNDAIVKNMAAEYSYFRIANIIAHGHAEDIAKIHFQDLHSLFAAAHKLYLLALIWRREDSAASFDAILQRAAHEPVSFTPWCLFVLDPARYFVPYAIFATCTPSALLKHVLNLPVTNKRLKCEEQLFNFFSRLNDMPTESSDLKHHIIGAILLAFARRQFVLLEALIHHPVLVPNDNGIHLIHQKSDIWLCPCFVNGIIERGLGSDSVLANIVNAAVVKNDQIILRLLKDRVSDTLNLDGILASRRFPATLLYIDRFSSLLNGDARVHHVRILLKEENPTTAESEQEPPLIDELFLKFPAKSGGIPAKSTCFDGMFFTAIACLIIALLFRMGIHYGKWEMAHF